MNRRTFLAMTAAPAALAAPTVPAHAATAHTPRSDAFENARKRLLALPGEKSFAIAVGGRSIAWRAVHRSNVPMFVGSANKTFILAKFLQEVEAGRLSEDALQPIDDSVRSLSSPVFGADLTPAKNLSGMTSARIILEAMITHSDNTATDAALRMVGADKVRAFVASAGLSATRIPDSTRRMFSYLAGAPAGTDKGWAGMKEIAEDRYFGPTRKPINKRETMISTADEMVSYYRRALRGEFYVKPETLQEFKRILAMGSLIARVVPPGIAAYAKGGSIDWQDFHALCAPGQMIVCETPVTFCFTLNWTSPQSAAPKVYARFAAAVAGILAETVSMTAK